MKITRTHKVILAVIWILTGLVAWFIVWFGVSWRLNEICQELFTNSNNNDWEAGYNAGSAELFPPNYICELEDGSTGTLPKWGWINFLSIAFPVFWVLAGALFFPVLRLIRRILNNLEF